MLNKDDMHAYQQRAAEWCDNKNRGFIWLGMGDGKTVIAGTLISSLGVRATVVGTKRIVEDVWPQELKKWEHLSNLSYSAAVGSKSAREKAVSSSPDVLGISYENLIWALKTKATSGRSLLVYDEISKMKSPSTKRFKLIHALLQKGFAPERSFGLTATPTMEGHVGLFSQWRSIGGDERLGKNITAFRQKFCMEIHRGNYSTWAVIPERVPEIEALIAPHVFTIEDHERPYTPHAMVVDVPIPWGSSGAKQAYRSAEKRLIGQVDGMATFTLASKGVAMTKARQLATGFMYDEDKTAHFNDEEKFDAIVEAYEELNGEPVLVFYQFEAERDRLLELLPGSQTIEGNSVERFNEGLIPALVLHPSSCSHGLNLQGGRYIFWSSLPQSGEQYLQANGRVDRQGQMGQPIIKRFLREDSVDLDSAALVEGKIADDSEVIDRMRQRNR